jgi:hypothetical protein
MKRIIAFIIRWHKHPIFLLSYSINFFRPQFIAGVDFYSDEEFVDQIKKGKSFIRLNDGEFHLMNGGSLAYQPYRKGIESSLRQLVREYSGESPYIIGLPQTCMNKTNEDLQQENKKYVWLPAKTMYRLSFPKNVKYGDGHAFYMDGFFAKNLEPALLDKHLLVVTNKQSIEAFKNNKAIPFTKVSFVETPSWESYSKYDQIYSDTLAMIQTIPQEEKVAIVFSTGPASKILVYEFSKMGYASYDIGKGFEVLYTGESIENRI